MTSSLKAGGRQEKILLAFIFERVTKQLEGGYIVYVILSNTLYSDGSSTFSTLKITVLVTFGGSFIAPVTYFV